jgi:GMP synthase-like glutamine amidotransferase
MSANAAFSPRRKSFAGVPTRVLFLQNCPQEGIGLYGWRLQELGLPWLVVHAYAGESLPSLDLHDAIIVGGTPVSVNEIDKHDFLTAEACWLREALDLGMPVLGICFGAQLLAKLLGAGVKKNPVKEIGTYPVRLTAAGRSDPIFQGFPKTFPVFLWHNDTFAIPPWGLQLAASRDCPNQGFRMGSTVGLQFHLEVTAPEASRWADAYTHELQATGRSKARVTRECLEQQPLMAELAGRLLDNFLAGATRLN